MKEKIIPRWEWRTFGEDFGGAEEKIQKYERGNHKLSKEKYILSRKSDENTKIRDDLMDIKTLKEVNDDSLEQWYPALKETFPLSKDKIKILLKDYFKVEVPKLGQDEYTFEEFLEKVVKSSDELKIVDVEKERFIYVINMAIVEIAEASFDGIKTRTICVEHADPDNVIKTVRELGLADYENINYIKAMKKAVDFE